ncbi:hypothetical protein QEO94_01235 [Kingella negevensis]|uniref:hypothetical protein n=1 Tax=Kingella negevensis TaxID=1522312 RepID=UPI00254363B2|nr:hypothetical protein [Kingella negevensis]WII93503.1 hypothetical protein QEO94_01235 [Kingella negevensis]
MSIERIFIVQNKLTGEFLKPDGIGSVETCLRIDQAGYFYDYQSAIETAVDEMDEAEILIFGFFQHQNNPED